MSWPSRDEPKFSHEALEHSSTMYEQFQYDASVSNHALSRPAVKLDKKFDLDKFANEKGTYILYIYHQTLLLRDKVRS